jgi:hypothetical protein
MIKLDARDTIAGAESRLLLAECKGPAFPGYTLEAAKECMQLMDLVLVNRLRNNPAQFMAKRAHDLIGIIKAPGQFAGFENYPNYNGGIASNLQSMINIANNPKDRRQGAYASFINAAIEVATGASIPDPSGGILAAWRTAGASSPGSNFVLYKTVNGNDFYRLN